MAYDTKPKGSERTKWSILLSLLAFLAGIAAMGWLFTNWAPARDLVLGTRSAPPAFSAQAIRPTPRAAPILPPSALEARIAALEEKLARQSITAGASGAVRSEGLLIAFAARRALERGLALGYLEGALQQQFGATQPRAVGVVLAAARQPVTIDALKDQLTALAPKLVRPTADASWEDSLRDTLSSLIIVRRAGAPATTPADRLARAENMVGAGRVDVALTEVARLPGAAHAATWMRDARRLVEAQRALDILEAAAIMQPGTAARAPTSPPAPARPVSETSI